MKYTLLIFFVFFIHICFAQKAGFTATIGVNTFTVKNGDVLHVCKGGDILYKTTAVGYNKLSWRYSNGTVNTGSGISFTVNYADTGSKFFTVQTVGFFNSKDDSIKVTVVVSEKEASLNADFKTTTTGVVCASIPIGFDGSLSQGTGLTYFWDFGDGTTATGINPQHAFITAVGSSGNQSFNVKLIVTNKSGCSEEITKSVTVTKIPDASLGNDPTNAELTVFNGLGTFRKCLKLDSYSFIFVNKSTTTSTNAESRIIWGDGSPDFVKNNWSLNASEQHVFGLGNTVIIFRVTNNTTGCIAEKKYNVFIGSNSEGSISLSSSTGNSGCLGTTLDFPLSNYENNAPGTLYYIYVNDGAPFPGPLDSFTHPPPAIYRHAFTSSSCGKTYEGYNNSFYIKLIAENACNLFPAGNSAYPIYISDTPRAKLYADSVACVNTPVTVSDISVYGSVINTINNQLDCSGEGKRLWKVTPSANFTLTTPGALGSYNGNFFDWNNWVSGQPTLNITFTAAGTYKIKLYTSNNNTCKKIDSTEITICVREVPKADIQFNAGDSCNATTIKFIAAAQNSCNGNKYTWSVLSSDISNCSASNTYNFVQNTNASSDSAIIKFDGAGKYSVVLNASAKGAATCPAGKDTGLITIKAPPLISSINNISSICIDNSIAPTATVVDCYSGETLQYDWKFPGAATTSSNLPVPGNIAYNAIGTQTITLNVTNSCGTATATKQFDVIANPIADAGADIIMCSGESRNIGNNIQAYTYDWSPKTGLSSYNSAKPFVTHINNGTLNDTLVYFLTASGGINCKDYDTVIVVVKPSPVVTVNPVLITICSGGSVAITAAGATNYTWSPATGLNTTSGNSVTASPNITTTYLVNGALANGCSADASVTVNVINNPVADAGSNKIICSGSPVTIGTTGTPGLNYSWSPQTGLSNALIAQPTATVFNNRTDNANDTVNYYLTVSLSGTVPCSSTGSVQVIIKKTPLITLSQSRQTLCVGDSSVLSAGGADSYTWFPADYLNTVTGNTVIAKPVESTVYSVIGLLNNNCSDTIPVSITVNPGAKATFEPSVTYADCAGYNLKDVIKVTASQERNAEYRWYKNGVLFYTSSYPNPPDDKLNTPGDSVNIQLITTSLYNCKADTTATVIFKTGDSVHAQFTTSAITGCEPLNITFNNGSSILDNTVKFLWNFGNGESSTGIQPGIVSFNSGPYSRDTTYKVKLTAQNNCSIDSFETDIRVLPKPVARFASRDSTLGCSPYSMYFDNTSAGNPLNYSWDFGDGYSFSTTKDTSVSHTYNSAVLDTFTIKLSATNGCGTDTLPLPVVIAPNSIKPQVSTYGNNLSGCAPFTVNFINNTTGAIKSIWTYGDGKGEELPGNIVNVSHTYYDTGTYNINVNFDNGCSKATITKQVVVYSKPEAVFSLINPDSIICSNKTVSINIARQTGDFNRLYWGDDNLFYSPPVTSHFYNNIGVYTIKLIAERVNNIGTVCADTAVQTIRIAQKPDVFTVALDTVDCVTGGTRLQAAGGVAYHWYPESNLKDASSATPFASPLTNTLYYVDIKGTSGCVVTDSVLVIADFSKASVNNFVPTAFTPNHDFLNDCVHVLKAGINSGNITALDFKIYDRWGQMVFNTNNNTDCWNGTLNGKIQPPGTYVYYLKLKGVCTQDKEVHQKGTIVLIR